MLTEKCIEGKEVSDVQYTLEHIYNYT